MDASWVLAHGNNFIARLSPIISCKVWPAVSSGPVVKKSPKNGDLGVDIISCTQRSCRKKSWDLQTLEWWILQEKIQSNLDLFKVIFYFPPW